MTDIDWDPVLVRRAAVAALDRVPTHVADQLAAAINDGRWEIVPLGPDWIGVHVDGFQLMACHRSVVSLD